ncbi:MAG: hypothetical protein KGL53_05025 [Elusimicrobia bacterium]|nr:hypothetical protein [Elusimicrobiota bacterium]
MTFRRLLRWALFWAAVAAVVRFVFFNHEDLTALAVFFAAGGAWYWLERRKMRELDSLVKTRRE